MNTARRVLFVFLGCSLTPLFAQSLDAPWILAPEPAQSLTNGTAPVFSPWPPAIEAVVDVGPHHRVVRWTDTETIGPGETRPVEHRYVELATGLNRFDDTAGGGRVGARGG